MALIEFEAMKKWAKIPKGMQERLLRNVYCRTCGTTTIVDYSIQSDDDGIILKGKCKKCGKGVARLIEGEE